MKPFLISTIILRNNLFFLLAASLLLHSCSIYKEVEVKEVVDVKITEFSEQGIKADVYLSINNPNGYKISMTESHIVLVFEGKTLGEVVLEEPLVIPKKSMTTQVMKVNTAYGDLSSLLGNILSIMFQSEFELQGRGYVKGKALFVARKVPVEFKQKLSRKDLGL